MPPRNAGSAAYHTNAIKIGSLFGVLPRFGLPTCKPKVWRVSVSWRRTPHIAAQSVSQMQQSPNSARASPRLVSHGCFRCFVRFMRMSPAASQSECTSQALHPRHPELLVGPSSSLEVSSLAPSQSIDLFALPCAGPVSQILVPANPDEAP